MLFTTTAQEQASTDHCLKNNSYNSPSLHSTIQSTTDDPACHPMWLNYNRTSLTASHRWVNIEVILFKPAISFSQSEKQPARNKHQLVLHLLFFF